MVVSVVFAFCRKLIMSNTLWWSFLLCWMAILMTPLSAPAQEVSDLNDYVEQLNDQCPIKYKDDWGINSFTMVGDRYALVDLQLPSNLAMFLPSLSSNADNVKQLWIKQLSLYGERWTDFVDKMVDAGRSVIVNLRPKGCDETYLITFIPSDFKK